MLLSICLNESILLSERNCWKKIKKETESERESERVSGIKTGEIIKQKSGLLSGLTL